MLGAAHVPRRRGASALAAEGQHAGWRRRARARLAIVRVAAAHAQWAEAAISVAIAATAAAVAHCVAIIDAAAE